MAVPRDTSAYISPTHEQLIENLKQLGSLLTKFEEYDLVRLPHAIYWETKHAPGTEQWMQELDQEAEALCALMEKACTSVTTMQGLQRQRARSFEERMSEDNASVGKEREAVAQNTTEAKGCAIEKPVDLKSEPVGVWTWDRFMKALPFGRT